MMKFVAPILLLACTTPSSAQLPLLFDHVNNQPGQELGVAIDGMGDVDGDGMSDLVVGLVEPGVLFIAPPGPGAARIYSGCTGALILGVTGGSVASGFGRAVAGLGDVNGDGTPDFCVSAPVENGVGRVHVVSGATGSILHSVTGTGPLAFFGAALARVGDVDGDMNADIIVGAPGHTGGSGRAAVYSSTSGALVFEVFGSLGNQMGRSVADAGDMDGDGVADILVGSPGLCTVTVHSGVDGSLIMSCGGPPFGDDFGASVTGLGDVNGDGTPDFAVGSPSASITGFMAGQVVVISGADARVEFSVDGQLGGDRLGHAVSGGADLDGDGIGDVVASAPGADVGDSNTGVVRAWSGATGAEILTFAGQGGQGIGSSLATMADANGDGIADVAIGSQSVAPGGGFAVVAAVGSRIYSAGLGGTQQLAIDWVSLGGGSLGFLVVLGADPFSVGALVGSPAAASWQSGPHTILVDPFGAEGAIIGFDMFGDFAFPVDLGDPNFAGRLVFLQAFANGAAGITTSNGLEMLFAR